MVVNRRLTMLFAVAALLGACALCGAVGGATIYVPGDHATIQAAIDAANSGDTIEVAAGTYTVTSTIDVHTPVTINGPQAGVDPRPSFGSTRTPGDAATEAIVTGGGTLNRIIKIEADNVTLNGLEFCNGTGDLVYSTSSVAIASPTIQHCMVHDSSGDEGVQLKTVTNGIYEYNYVYSTGGDGLNMAYSTGGTIQYNECRNIHTPDAAIYMYNDGSVGDFSATINGNLVYDCDVNDGIKMGAKNGHDETFAGGQIRDNVVFDCQGDGIVVYTSDTVVDGNEVFNCRGNVGDSWGGAVYVSHHVDNVSITNNNVHDNTTPFGAVSIGDVGYMPTNVVVNNNDIVNNTVGMDVEATALPAVDAENNWWGSADGPSDPIGAIELPATPEPAVAAMLNAAPGGSLGNSVDENADYFPWSGSAGSASPTLTANDAAGATGSTVQLVAKLIGGGSPLVGKTVSFKVGAVNAGSGTTDGAGIATVSYTITEGAGAHGISALFTGDATWGAASDTATLTVTAPPPTFIVIAPKPGAVVAGATIAYTAVDSNQTDVTGSTTFYASAGAGGSWAANVYTAETAGAWTVTGVYGSLVDTGVLNVSAGAATTVVIDPAASTITTAQSQVYAVEATDAQGNSWNPMVAQADWTQNGAGSFGVADNTYAAAGGDAGNTVTISCTVDGTASNVASLEVMGATGVGNILAWDKDDQFFYLCSNAADPSSGTLLVDGPNPNVGGTGISVYVSGRPRNLQARVTTPGGLGDSLRVRSYMRGGALYRAYQYSTIGAVSTRATYQSGRTYLRGVGWKTGYWGLHHTIVVVPPAIASGATEQP